MRDCFLVTFASLLLAGCGESAPPASASSQTHKDSPQINRSDAENSESPALVSTDTPRAVIEPPAPGESPDLGYVPDDAFAVVLFHARRAFASRALAALPYDELFAGSREAWSFDPREVEHWLLFLTPPVEGEPLGTPYSPGAVMRFVKPVDGRQLIATRGAIKEVQLGGKTCYVQQVQPATAFYLPDDRTIVFAAEKQLAKILAAEQTRNPLAGRLARADRDCDLHVLINLEPLTGVLDEVSQAASQQLPPVAMPYVRALGDVSTIAVRADLSGERLLAASVEARGPEAATRLHELAKQSGPLVQAAYAALRAEVVRGWSKDASQGVLDITDSIMARAAVSYEPAAVRLDVARPSQLDDLGRRVRTAHIRAPANR